jgi:RES domain-containing protein
MAPSPRTTAVVEALFRYSNYDTPFWARSNTRPGRWHVPGDGPTQYLSLTTEGAWADLIRSEELRSEEEVAMVKMPLWVASVDQSTVVDYSEFSYAEEAGFVAEALVEDDHQRCQAEGKRLRALGYTGVLAPSAALPDELNLTIFGARVSIAWGSKQALASAIPAKVLMNGSPPAGLVERVRFIGQPHAAYEAWAAEKAAKSKVRRRSPGDSA